MISISYLEGALEENALRERRLFRDNKRCGVQMNYRGGRVVCQERAPHLKPYYISVSQDGERRGVMDSFTRAVQDAQKPQGVRVA